MIDYDVVWLIVEEDLPPLVREVNLILGSIEGTS